MRAKKKLKGGLLYIESYVIIEVKEVRYIKKQYIEKFEALQNLNIPNGDPIETFCMIEGIMKTTTTGEFLRTGIMSQYLIDKGLDTWHRDFMVEPIIDALLKVYSDQ